MYLCMNFLQQTKKKSPGTKGWSPQSGEIKIEGINTRTRTIKHKFEE